MIQDIGNNRFNNEFLQKKADGGSLIFCFRDGEILTREEDGAYIFPRLEQFEGMGAGDAVYAFSVNDEPIFLLKKEPEYGKTPEGFSFGGIRPLVAAEPQWAALAAVTGSHLQRWYSQHRFCGVCGNEMRHSHRERAMVCEDCGYIQYPRINPVIMAAVTNGDKILVTRYAGREYKGLALIAGFAEIGENLEAAAAREVMEEVGLKIKNLSYFGSQPWGFSDSLISGFFAEADGDDRVKLDRDELSEAVWLSRGEIPPQDTRLSITSAMLEAFRTGER